MKRLGRLTLKREVFLLCLTYTLIFTVVFILIFGNALFSSKLNEMKQKLHNSNTQMKIYLDTLFDGCTDILAYMDTTLNLASQDPAEQAETLEAFDSITGSMPLLTVFVGYADGSLLINDYTLPEGYDASARSWYRKAAACYPEPLIAFPYQEYTTGEWCFCTARALANDEGEIVAVVAVDFMVDEVFENAIAQSEYTTQMNYLINEDGICIYHPQKEYIGSNMLENLNAAADMFANDDDFVEYTFHDKPRIAVSHYLSGSDSILVSSINRSDALQPAFAVVRNVLLGLLLLSVLMSALFMMVFDYRYVSSVKSLKARLAALLGGSSIPDTKKQPYPNHEFSEIADSMEELTKRTMNRKAEELNAILESSSDGILVLDRNDNILHYNARLLRLWGLSQGGVYKTYGDLQMNRRMLMGGESVPPAAQENETELFYLKTGIILERYTRVLTEREHIDGILCVYRDVTQKMKKEEQLKEIANTDFLTGLSNRRYFAFQAAREFRKARQNNEPLAMLLLDIDDFKRINDTYGHDVGDRALKAFAMHLRQCSRRSDILGRYGGEEFCVLLPYTALDVAEQIAERMRLQFESTAIDHRGNQISWTVSIGVSINDPAVTSVETLIKHADIACYAAKQRGRNCVQTYTQQDPKPQG